MKHEQKSNAFVIPVRVYYEDTDAAGVVYYANYFKYFERCRTEWLRSIGHDQSALAAAHDIGFVVRSASAEYLLPARLDDALLVGLEVEQLGRAQVTLLQHVRRPVIDENGVVSSEELVTGRVKIVCVSLSAMKTTPIPKELREQLEALA